MDEHLDGLSDLCHNVVKRLKMGETGVIQCSKEYPAEEVQSYVRAYAQHKEKWFDPITYDKASNTVRTTRAPIPNWIRVDEIDPEEEP